MNEEEQGMNPAVALVVAVGLVVVTALVLWLVAYVGAYWVESLFDAAEAGWDAGS